jgi:hypothetical protein
LRKLKTEILDKVACHSASLFGIFFTAIPPRLHLRSEIPPQIHSERRDQRHVCPDQKRHGDVPPAIASFVIVVCHFDRRKTLIEDLSRFAILRRQSNRDDSLGERKAVSGVKACAVSKGAA